MSKAEREVIKLPIIWTTKTSYELMLILGKVRDMIKDETNDMKLGSNIREWLREIEG